MSPVRATWGRTVGHARNLYLTAVALGGFVAAAAVSFALGLDAGEGGALALAPLWSVRVAPLLPLLAALLGMDSLSGERSSGRLDALLATAVSERDIVLGKFLGVWSLLLAGVALALAATLGTLFAFAPACFAGSSPLDFLPGLAILALQGALWSAVAVASSAHFRHGAGAVALAATLTFVLPRALWAAALAWAPTGSAALGEMPLDAHVRDFASGALSTGVLVSYAVAAAAALFVAELRLGRERLPGRRSRPLRFVSRLNAALTLACAALAAALAVRFDATFEWSVGGSGVLAPRTRKILAEATGDATVTCLLPRKDPHFRETARFLRSLRGAAAALGGLRLDLRYVDPSWDFGAAERLVRRGAKPPCLFFERPRRSVQVPLAGVPDERRCASAILTLTRPPQRRRICWTCGHGEAAFDGYGAFGMSDFARELSREGYSNEPLDLAADKPVPEDCALIVVAGAREDFSRAETARLDAYLQQGGRLLALLGSAESGGVASLLPSWGIRPEPAAPAAPQTLSGTDAIVSDFSDHPIVAPLDGARIVLERPVALAASAAAEGAAADRATFTALARVGGRCVAAVAERGAGTGADLAYRPTRLVAVGDATFAMNGPLAARANANRDFLLNCVAYLSGSGAPLASGGAGAFVLDLGRDGRRRLVVVSAGAVPLALTLFLALCAYRRRHRR